MTRDRPSEVVEKEDSRRRAYRSSQSGSADGQTDIESLERRDFDRQSRLYARVPFTQLERRRGIEAWKNPVRPLFGYPCERSRISELEIAVDDQVRATRRIHVDQIDGE